jgi:hypothetical protein
MTQRQRQIVYLLIGMAIMGIALAVWRGVNGPVKTWPEVAVFYIALGVVCYGSSAMAARQERRN